MLAQFVSGDLQVFFAVGLVGLQAQAALVGCYGFPEFSQLQVRISQIKKGVGANRRGCGSSLLKPLRSYSVFALLVSCIAGIVLGYRVVFAFAVGTFSLWIVFVIVVAFAGT